MKRYKRKFNEVSEEEVLKKYKEEAIKAISILFKQASSGYGSGNAIGHIMDVLEQSIPKMNIGFLQNKSNWDENKR